MLEDPGRSGLRAWHVSALDQDHAADRRPQVALGRAPHRERQPAARPQRRVRPVAGWSPEADTLAQPEVVAVAVLCAAVTIFLGLMPDPLFDVARDVSSALPGLH
jgi:hypothetical protein